MCIKTTKIMTVHNSTSRPLATISPSTIKEITSIASLSPVLKRNRRRVSFSNIDDVFRIESRCSFIPVEDHHNTWYRAHELDFFKFTVRSACQEIRDNGLPSSNTAAPTMYNTARFPTRGLEQRICKNRQRNKALSIWGTLKAQQRSKDPEFIAMIARRCSFTASQLAYMEAARDFCEIYNPLEVDSLSAQIELFASQSFPIKLKRKSTDSASVSSNGDCRSNSNGRNVRIRIS